ncbi:MAG: ribosome-associated translation inhibitor RaiA [Rhodospirillaceae bacterium]|jgi:ribosomal subunit interface protein|nr:ribosome-associated translation inhibitor RaiA [Rhodospirillaceae bacterium]MBT3887109.1 ribosome-associated translation inhibitor RaiA [Rhodospirillaceae bacterium]MBT4117383.1 ribosome-associated translation inhibitor RaiA [Rhodospirillaceae bacterium]MBT4671810.1 ribosome-associated translation inhibitor RaiA [Rhodospirillaceae bacterium]MBT4720410.1 ribosome-associated translation inhibitor RaiA [Rhodospirillaceae bacterium]
MSIPAQISFRNFDRSEAVEERIQEKVDKLEQYFDRITNCQVVVEARHRSHNKGNLYHIKVVMSVPGEDVVVTRDPKDAHAHEDIYVAIRDAFEAVRRQLKKHVRMTRQRPVKEPVPEV